MIPIPGAIALAIGIIGIWLDTRAQSRPRDTGLWKLTAPLAIGIAFFVAFPVSNFGQWRFPPFPPTESTAWLPWIAIVAMIATMIPAVRASRTDPIRTLRPE